MEINRGLLDEIFVADPEPTFWICGDEIKDILKEIYPDIEFEFWDTSGEFSPWVYIIDEYTPMTDIFEIEDDDFQLSYYSVASLFEYLRFKNLIQNGTYIVYGHG